MGWNMLIPNSYSQLQISRFSVYKGFPCPPSLCQASIEDWRMESQTEILQTWDWVAAWISLCHQFPVALPSVPQGGCGTAWVRDLKTVGLSHGRRKLSLGITVFIRDICSKHCPAGTSTLFTLGHTVFYKAHAQEPCNQIAKQTTTTTIPPPNFVLFYKLYNFVLGCTWGCPGAHAAQG